jgi:hypothetical protein
VSPLARPAAECGYQAFAADFGDGNFNFPSPSGGYELPLEITEAPCFVLTDEFADVLAGRTPIAGSNLPFNVFFQSFRKRDIQRGHRHSFII